MKRAAQLTVFTITLLLMLGSFSIFVSAQDISNIKVIVYQSPFWGCCKGWGSHLEKAGFKVKRVEIDNLSAIKQKYNIPSNLQSCHTGIVGPYFLEGHIPVEDIKRLLREKPEIRGLAVPGMPMGSPGMEGAYSDPYRVFSIDAKNKLRVYSHHWNDRCQEGQPDL